MKRLIYLLLIFTVLALTACSSSEDDEPTEAPAEPTTAAESIEGRPLIIADISGNPERVIERTQPLADYLAARLADFGISSGEIRVAPDLETMIEWFNAGEVDLYFDSLYPAMIVSDETGAVPILRRWRDDVGEYHSVFFVAADSGIESLDDLNGRLVAFQEDVSTSGYMVPAAYLISNGFTIQAFEDTDAEVPEDVVGYVFSGDDDNTLQWVISGLVSVGVTDNIAYEELPEETRANLVIIAETDPVPRQVALANDALEPELITEITNLLLALEENDEGLAVLDAFGTSQFDDFPQGIEQALNDMRELYNLVQGE